MEVIENNGKKGYKSQIQDYKIAWFMPGNIVKKKSSNRIASVVMTIWDDANFEKGSFCTIKFLDNNLEIVRVEDIEPITEKNIEFVKK